MSVSAADSNIGLNTNAPLNDNIQVADFEEEDDLYLGCRVLAHKHRTGPGTKLATTPILEYGTILKKHNDLIYLVQFGNVYSCFTAAVL